MLGIISRYFTTYLTFIVCLCTVLYGQDVGKLPNCVKTNNSGYVLVSTLDGKFSAVDFSGTLSWQIDTGPGPLLTSNIHNLELSNNGQWMRIIPSLSGSIYRFDGSNIDAIPLTAENLLKSSFRYSDDLVIAGGYEVRTYGISLKTGTPLYECNTFSCKNFTDGHTQYDDILLVERNTQTVRAVAPTTGIERWNFSVGLHDVKVAQIGCINTEKLTVDVSAVLPDGLLIVVAEDAKWEYKFESPIVNVWKWNGRDVEHVDVFTPSSHEESAKLYVGMHNKQLYIHESENMQLQVFNPAPESEIIARIPWKPIPASKLTVNSPSEIDSTALSVLYASEYVNGNGYYLFVDSGPKICANKGNKTIKIPLNETSYTVNSIAHWWKEVLVISVTTAAIFNVMCRSFGWHRRPNQEVIFVERHVKVPVLEEVSTSRTASESSDTTFSSRYANDFETVSCLGKGGFGVVFQVKQKIDECNYAIKRIPLPQEQNSRERVMREVKALAKLDHYNIVRYFNSWVENPPHDWHVQYDRQWIDNTSSNVYETSKRADTMTSNADSFIVFERGNDTTTRSATSEHTQKKIDWRRPGRKSHSLDITTTGVVALAPPPLSPMFLYIQMQLCRRESLREWLKENRARNFEQVLDIFSQILAAVEYVHLQGLIHRDLKPSNIFFSLEGRIKVGDFGLVTDMQETDSELNVTHSPRGHTKAVGTRLYMSPEQLVNKRYNYKVDIYSLGLIFLELLIPFGTEMERVCVLTDLRDKKYPEGFCQKHAQEHRLLDMMLCEDPNKRPTTFGIKARPPLNDNEAELCAKYHFELPVCRKTCDYST